MSDVELYTELVAALNEAEAAATRLSNILGRFNLANIPCCDRDLNHSDVGTKIMTAKFLLHVMEVSEVSAPSQITNKT